MRRLALLAPLLLLACAETPAPPMSYARCSAAETCGISTRCESVTLSSTGAAATLCTAPCVSDQECPGWAGRCVPGTSADGGAPRCFLGCAVDGDCRAGTVCLPLQRSAPDGGVERVCAPDFGPRPCDRDEACAPFALRCLRPDGGVAAGTERRCVLSAS